MTVNSTSSQAEVTDLDLTDVDLTVTDIESIAKSSLEFLEVRVFHI